MAAKSDSKATFRAFHAAQAVGNVLYMWGGDVKDSSNKMAALDLQKECFEDSKEICCGLAGMAVTSVGSTVYTFGGWSPSTRVGSNAIYEVDLNTRIVRQLAQDATNLPKRRCGSRMILYNDCLIIFGGSIDGGQTNEVLIFNLATGKCLKNALKYTF